MQPELRIEVLTFSHFMELTLRQNDETKGKRGWRSMSFDELFTNLIKEVKELKKALDKRIVEGDKSFILKEAVDVANFAMMIFDKSLTGSHSFGRKYESFR